MKHAFENVYELVRQIPKGKVMTYGEIGRVLHISPRVVGYALHMNPDGDKTPCHRVVNRSGRVAPGYAFGGKDVQRKRLEEEGLKFKDKEHVDLKRHLSLFR